MEIIPQLAITLYTHRFVGASKDGVTETTALISLRSKQYQLCINKTVTDVLLQLSTEALCTVSTPSSNCLPDFA